jgi:hypothetical protein
MWPTRDHSIKTLRSTPRQISTRHSTISIRATEMKKIVRTALLTLVLPFMLLAVAVEAVRAVIKKDLRSLTFGEVIVCYSRVWRQRAGARR